MKKSTLFASIICMLFFSFSLVSCGDDDEAEIEEEPEFTTSFTADGSTINFPADLTFQNNGFINITLQENSDGSGQILGISFPDSSRTQIDYFFDSSRDVDAYYTLNDSTTYSAFSGVLKLSTLDTNSRSVAGTFRFRGEANNFQMMRDTVEITNGSFSVNY